MKHSLPVAVLLTLLFLGIVIVVSVERGDNQAIEQWARLHDAEVVSVERCMFSLGPFWIREKSQRVYRVELADGRVAWMRAGLSGNDWIVE